MTDLIERASGVYVPSGVHRQLQERIAELEFRAEDSEWIALGDTGRLEFSRAFVGTITRLARLMYIKNPLILRGVQTKANYVFGRGCTIQAKDENINAVVQAFLDDEHNQNIIASQRARVQREIELQTDGNLFFVLMPHLRTGHIRVRLIPVDEITDKISDPDDRNSTWYYRREWIERSTDLSTGEPKEVRRTAYYRDHRFKGDQRKSIGAFPIIDMQFIYHLRVGGFEDWKFGISEIYAPLDWAKAYKVFLENWSTIVEAYATFAFKVKTMGGKDAVANAKTKLGSTITTTTSERNPKPVTGSNIIMQQGNDIEPIRTAGATTKAEDGRRLLLMVAAAFGLPETFWGDVSVGTLATARSLDRPTELMLTNRQALWAEVYHHIISFALYWSVIAIDGRLRAVAEQRINEYGEETVVFDEDTNTHIDIDFPSILERDVQTSVNAIISGATFDGKTPTILNDPKMLARMILVALGENDIDEILEKLYPAAAIAASTTNDVTQAAADMRAAVEALREAISTKAVPE